MGGRSAGAYKDAGAAPFLAVFIDAPNDVLDARLRLRGAIDREKVDAQREEDRRY